MKKLILVGLLSTLFLVSVSAQASSPNSLVDVDEYDIEEEEIQVHDVGEDFQQFLVRQRL